jgi:hypothetical protein
MALMTAPMIPPDDVAHPAGVAAYLAPHLSVGWRAAAPEVRAAVGGLVWVGLAPFFAVLTRADVLQILLRVVVELAAAKFGPASAPVIDWAAQGLHLFPGGADPVTETYLRAAARLAKTAPSTLSPAARLAAYGPLPGAPR